MSEPSAVELFLRIDKLEKELQAEKQANLNLQNAEIEIIQRDKEISDLNKTISAYQTKLEEYNRVFDEIHSNLNDKELLISNLKNEISLYKIKVEKYRNFLRKVLVPMKSFYEFNNDLINAINDLLNN